MRRCLRKLTRKRPTVSNKSSTFGGHSATRHREVAYLGSFGLRAAARELRESRRSGGARDDCVTTVSQSHSDRMLLTVCAASPVYTYS